MIEIKELMIGNLVMKDGEIHSVNPYDIYEISKFEGQPIPIFEKTLSSTYFPIPITKEWLLKFGFINDDAQRYFKNGIYLILYDEGCSIMHKQIHINYFYIHQLQNLFFSLTGKQLEIKK